MERTCNRFGEACMLCFSAINGYYARVSARNFDESSNNTKEILNEKPMPFIFFKIRENSLIEKGKNIFDNDFIFKIIRLIVQILLRY